MLSNDFTLKANLNVLLGYNDEICLKCNFGNTDVSQCNLPIELDKDIEFANDNCAIYAGDEAVEVKGDDLGWSHVYTVTECRNECNEKDAKSFKLGKNS